MKDDFQPHQPKSLSELMSMTDRISLEPDLVRSLEDPDFTSKMIKAILHGGYFSEDEIERLRDLLGTLDVSFRYQERIVEETGREFRMDHSSEREDPSFREMQVRSPAFRRSILEAYDEICAVCGMRLIAYNGVSVNDAAHILPYSRFHNDDIRNGICLCKNHHWLFDRFLISFDRHYRVMISKGIEPVVDHQGDPNVALRNAMAGKSFDGTAI